MKKIVIGLVFSALLCACNFSPVVEDALPDYFDEVAIENDKGIDCNKTGCSDDSVCYHSQNSGMGSNGLIAGAEEGDLKCHLKCENDNDCDQDEVCKEVEMKSSDLYWTQKFCLSRAKSCELIKTEIYDALDQVNYCNKNEDCAILSFGGCPFGCCTIGNKDTDLSLIHEGLNKYLEENCSTCPNRQCEGCCPLNQGIICSEGKCVETC